jgi:tetratricopeptide (TPR) repeat protein
MNYYRAVLLGMLTVAFVLGSQSCNYNYYQGLKLEKLGRFEEATIEFHRAYTSSPEDDDYREAYLRMATRTTEDLLERYEKYRNEKQYLTAFRRLEKANTLTPDHPKVQEELKKWYRVLLAGKVDLVEIRAMNNQIPLTDQIVLEIRFNTPNVTRSLEAPIDYQTKTFSVEDILYDPPQNLLMLYSINSIGVKLVNSTTRQVQFLKFIDFKTPVLVDVQGELNPNQTTLTSVSDYYPYQLLSNQEDQSYWFPKPGLRYSLVLKNDRISVNSSVSQTDFLPQLLYINREDRRYFLDFGHLQLAQKKVGGLWTMRRHVTEGREYLKELRKNLILNPYFYFREGGYPFVNLTRNP